MSSIEPVDQPEAGGIRPLVTAPTGGRAVWIFVGVAVLGGSVLFAALEGRRSAVTAPSISPASDESDEMAGMIASPPALAIPPDYASRPMMPFPYGAPQGPSSADPGLYPDTTLPERRPITPQRRSPGITASQPAGVTDPDLSAAMQVGSGAWGRPSQPEFVYDATRDAAAPRRTEQESDGEEAGKGDERVKASRFANPSTTVPKGTVIQAVLETALDSTRAGFARAIVSRDIYGFDGRRVMIARGSRLIGDYKADLAAGQKRALIQWQRLMRPDGVVINLASPSADPLGRAGVKGKVNSHFLERFGGTMLQSALNIGTQVAANKLANGSVIYAVPLMTQAAPAIPQEKVVPTLTVRQGTSVSVFVARDLDFTTVE